MSEDWHKLEGGVWTDYTSEIFNADPHKFLKINQTEWFYKNLGLLLLNISNLEIFLFISCFFFGVMSWWLTPLKGSCEQKWILFHEMFSME